MSSILWSCKISFQLAHSLRLESRHLSQKIISRKASFDSFNPSASAVYLKASTLLSKVPRRGLKSRARKDLSIEARLSNKGSNAKRRKATLSMENTAGQTVQQDKQVIRQSLREFFEVALKKPRTVPIPRWVTPKHVTFTLAEAFGHSSFVLVAFSYAVDDFLMLRIIAVAGSTAMLFFAYFHPHGRVLWLPFKWNCLFIAINSYRVGKAYWNNYLAEKLSPELLELRNNSFYLMDPVDYARFVTLGTMHDVSCGQVLTSQGEPNGYIRLVVDGELKVLREGKLAYKLGTANFVSESGLHAGLLLKGEVESCCTIVGEAETTRLLTWDRTELMDLMEKYPGIRSWVKTSLSWDIVRKLKEQRALQASGEIDDPDEWTERRNRQTQHRYAAILKNILSHHPQYLKDRRKQLQKYQMIHSIDDEKHEAALRECGWTPEEFKAGERRGSQYYNDEEEGHDLQWYVTTALLRVFG